MGRRRRALAHAAFFPVKGPNSLSVSNPTEIVGFSTKNLLPAGNINRPVTILGAE
jgi:hypothetical protein